MTTNKTVLVIDDSIMLRRLLKKAISGCGWEVVGEAQNGQEGIEQFTALRPALVTCDLVMPQFDGHHAVQGIRAISDSIPIVMVSAVVQDAKRQQLEAEGVNYFIGKPFNAADIEAMLNKFACSVGA